MTSEYESELLVCLIEECAEIQKDACKALRFGMDDHHPEGPETNRQLLARELGDLLCVMDLLAENGTLDLSLSEANRQSKREKLSRYLKHRPGIRE